MHLPVIMVTALDQPEDRVAGLEAGADDFLSKPVNDLALVTRVKSLLRVKMLTDELRLRAITGVGLGMEPRQDIATIMQQNPRGRILVVDDRASSYERIVKNSFQRTLGDGSDQSAGCAVSAADSEFDAAVISSELAGYDYLRLCSQLRSLERTRMMPIVVVADRSRIRA